MVPGEVAPDARHPPPVQEDLPPKVQKFIAMLATQTTAASSSKDLGLLYDEFDADNSGSLDLEELSKLVSLRAESLDKEVWDGEDVDKVCKFLVPDGKRDVTRQEWIKTMQSGVSWALELDREQGRLQVLH